jgi:hypothetical protein
MDEVMSLEDWLKGRIMMNLPETRRAGRYCA